MSEIPEMKRLQFHPLTWRVVMGIYFLFVLLTSLTFAVESCKEMRFHHLHDRGTNERRTFMDMH